MIEWTWLTHMHTHIRTQALEFQQDDQPCLVARSKCYLQLGDASLALQDAEASLKEDKKYHKVGQSQLPLIKGAPSIIFTTRYSQGLYQKAEALYTMGDFEYALVFYHRGHKIRPELHHFTLGIQKAQEAINNSIGSECA